MKRFKYDHAKYDLAKLPPDSIDRLTLERMLPNEQVLELGCATGYMTNYLTHELHCQVVGVDISAKVHATIAGDLNHADTWKKIKSHGRFDTVLASNVIEHLTDTMYQLKQIRSVLKPGGRLVIVVPNICWWRSRWKLLRGSWGYDQYGLWDETHVRWFSLPSIRKNLVEAGFVIEDEAYDPAGGAKWFTPLLRLFPNAYAYQVVMIARRD
jgi:SAM-dependent methyltransferase